MPMGMENPLLSMGWNFEFYCSQLNNSVGIPKMLMFFPVEWESIVVLQFKHIFLTGDKFSADRFSWYTMP